MESPVHFVEYYEAIEGMVVYQLQVLTGWETHNVSGNSNRRPAVNVPQGYGRIALTFSRVSADRLSAKAASLGISVSLLTRP